MSLVHNGGFVAGPRNAVFLIRVACSSGCCRRYVAGLGEVTGCAQAARAIEAPLIDAAMDLVLAHVPPAQRRFVRPVEYVEAAVRAVAEEN